MTKNSLSQLHSIIVELELLEILTLNILYTQNKELVKHTSFRSAYKKHSLVLSLFFVTSTLIKLSLVLSNLHLR